MTTTQRTPDLQLEAAAALNDLPAAASTRVDEVISRVSFAEQISHDISPKQKPKAKKKKKNALPPLEQIIQPLFISPERKPGFITPSHVTRKKVRTTSGGSFAEPESRLFGLEHDVGFTNETLLTLEGLCGQFNSFSTMLDDKLPGSSERDTLKSTIESLTQALHSASSKDLNAEISSVIDKLKSDAERSASEVGTSIKHSLIFTGLASSMLFYLWKPSPARAVAVGVSLGAALMFTDLSKNTKLILSVFGSLGTIGISLLDNNAEEDSEEATPEMDFADLDKGITSICSMIAVYVSTISGKSVPVELFKNFGSVGRVKSSITDAASVILEVIERIYNWLRDKIFDLESVSFFHSKHESVDEYCKLASLLTEEERTGKLARTQENYLRVHGTVADGDALLSKIPRDQSCAGAIEVLKKSIASLTEIKKDFERMNFNMSGGRQEAVGILLKGGPGTGKSVIMETLNYAILAQTLSETDYQTFQSKPSTFVYNRQFECKYWDGYTAQKVITMYDDFGQCRDIAGNPDGEAMNIIRGGSAFEMDLHCAGMNLKGVTTFQSKFIVATTNMEQLQFESIISVEAVERRFDIHVIVVPKPAYCKNPNAALMNRRFDYSKLPVTSVNDDGHYMPGTHSVTDLNPDCQDFYICKKKLDKYMPSGEPISFDQLVALIMEQYRFKRNQFLLQEKNFKKTAETYRSNTADKRVPDVNPSVKPFTDKFREKCAVPQMWAPEDEILPDPQPDLVMEDIFEDASDHFIDEMEMPDDSAIHYTDREDRESEGPGDPTFWPQAEPQGDSYGQGDQDYARLLEAVRLPQVRPMDEQMRFITGYPAPVIELVKRMLQRYHEMDVMDQRETDTAIRRISETYWYGLDHTVPALILAAMITRDGSNFVVHFMENRLRFYPCAGWGMHVPFEPIPPKNEYPDYAGQLKEMSNNFCAKANDILSRTPIMRHLHKVVSLRNMLNLGLIFIAGRWAYKMFRKVVGAIFGIAMPESFGHSDKLRNHKQKQYWRSSNEVLRSLDLHAAPQSGGIDANGMTLSESLGRKRVFEFLVESNFGTNEMKQNGYMLMVSGRIGIIPYHFIAKMADCCERNPKFLQAKVLLRRPGREHSYPFIVEDIIRGHKTGVLQDVDCVMVELPQTMQPVRHGVDYFALKSDYTRIAKNIPFMLYFGNKNGIPGFTHGIASARDKPLKVVDGDLGSYHVRDSYTYEACTDKGDCGAPFFALNSAVAKRKIFGIHVAGCGFTGESYSAALCQEDILEDLKLFDEQPETEEDVSDVHPQGGIEAFSRGQFDEYAIVSPAPTRNYNSKIIPSRMYGSWAEPLTGPALLKKKILDDGTVVDPLHNAQGKYCFPPIWFDKESVSICKDVLYSYLIQVSNHRMEKRLLSYREAINGIPTEQESRGISAGTSPGYPMNVSKYENRKKWLFEHEREGPIFEERFAQIEVELQEAESKYLNNIRPSWYFVDCLKDERRPFSKIESGSTRMFSGCPFIYLVLWKKYFGAFNLEYQANRVKNGSAIGMNPYSTEWHDLAEKLKMFDHKGSQVGAGDYAGYDGSEKPEIHYAILEIINRWYGDSEENQRVRSLMWLELVNSKHIVDGVVYQWSSSLPSGHPFTIVVNSLYNHMAFLLCWKKKGLDPRTFYDCVYLCVCGDDNIFTVHPDYRDIFNEITICAPMKELGLTYTTETKGEAIYPFRELEDVEFLKRGFRKEPILGRYVGPLRLNVVLEIPFWTKATSDRHNIAAGNVIESLKELSLHPREIYDEYSVQIIEAFQSKYSNLKTPKPLVMAYATRQAETCEEEYFF